MSTHQPAGPSRRRALAALVGAVVLGGTVTLLAGSWSVLAFPEAIALVVVALVSLGVIVLAGSDAAAPYPEVILGTTEAGRIELARELARSRRHGRRFSIVKIVEADGGTATTHDLLSALQPGLRTTDRAWSDGSAAIALLPETDGAQAQQFVGRLRAAAPALLSRVEVEIATFPETGLTSGALLDRIEHGVAADLIPVSFGRAAPVPAEAPDDISAARTG